MGRRAFRWTPDQRNRLRELVAQGLTGYEIGERFGVSQHAIGMQVFQMGLHLTGKQTAMDRRLRGNPFYDARRRAGMTRQEAEERSGISVSTLYLYETGQQKPAQLVLWRTLAQTYGCTMSDLLGEEVLDHGT